VKIIKMSLQFMGIAVAAISFGQSAQAMPVESQLLAQMQEKEARELKAQSYWAWRVRFFDRLTEEDRNNSSVIKLSQEADEALNKSFASLMTTQTLIAQLEGSKHISDSNLRSLIEVKEDQKTLVERTQALIESQEVSPETLIAVDQNSKKLADLNLEIAVLKKLMEASRLAAYTSVSRYRVRMLFGDENP